MQNCDKIIMASMKDLLKTIQIEEGTIVKIFNDYYVMKQTEIQEYVPKYSEPDDLDELDESDDSFGLNGLIELLNIDAIFYDDKIFIHKARFHNYVTKNTQLKLGDINIIMDPGLKVRPGINSDYRVTRCKVQFDKTTWFDPEDVTTTVKYKAYWLDSGADKKEITTDFIWSKSTEGMDYNKEIRYECGGTQVEESSMWDALVIDRL